MTCPSKGGLCPHPGEGLGRPASPCCLPPSAWLPPLVNTFHHSVRRDGRAPWSPHCPCRQARALQPPQEACPWLTSGMLSSAALALLPARRRANSDHVRQQHAARSCHPGHAGARQHHSLSPGTGPGAGGPPGRLGRVGRHRCGSASSHRCKRRANSGHGQGGGVTRPCLLSTSPPQTPRAMQRLGTVQVHQQRDGEGVAPEHGPASFLSSQGAPVGRSGHQGWRRIHLWRG